MSDAAADGEDPTRVAIARQGGGSHTASIAGVLKGLLREWDDDELVGISGTSGGAFNALAAWYGPVTADEDRAIELLDAIREDLTASGFSGRLVNGFVVSPSKLGSAGVPMLRVSPYDVPGPEAGEEEIRGTSNGTSTLTPCRTSVAGTRPNSSSER